MSPFHIAASLVRAIGRPDFPEHLLSVYRDLADCDLCSAFIWDSGDSGPRLLFAAGTHPQIPGFALSASRAYAQSYWRLDAVARQNMDPGLSGLSLLRTSAADIRNPDYRSYCYQRGGISERLTLFDADWPGISVSGYRTVARGPMSSDVAHRIEDAAPVLMAALRRHNELMDERAAQSPTRNALLQRAREWGLSAREAQVVVGLATGQSQSEIAKHSGLALNSVITYRRRAYQKLKVADRRALRAMCERLIVPAAT